MLKRIDLQQFKCFEELHLPLAQLTLLTGLNAAGKSSVLQALVLLHQTMMENVGSRELDIDGSVISLGTVADVINQNTGKNRFGIGLAWEDSACFWDFATNNRRTLTIPLVSFQWWNGEEAPTNFSISEEEPTLEYLLPLSLVTNQARSLVDTLRSLVYIGAERIGPREAYLLTTLKRKTDVGKMGERTPSVLYQFSDYKPLEGLLLPGVAPTLERQVEAWMNQFFPGVVLDLTPILRSNLVSLGIRTSAASEFQRPQNVGYGLTHILPILTACLVAKRGDVLLIENPEAHLHPAGQALMGRFLAIAASAGVQILLETHSDHVLNGIRRSVRKSLLPPEDVAIHFFLPPGEHQEFPQVTSLLLNAKGALDSWPEGFFDQFDKDISVLAGWGD